ncbi:MAG: ATP-binding cassette domain-containing protein [Bryobacteraceae bacterium]|jgi:putative ABC transport system ATP-binding protein
MLRVEGISKVFWRGTARELNVLDGVGFTILPGQFAILLGSNGAGKSTLLSIIAGELRPDMGRTWVGDVQLTGLKAYRRSRYLSYIRQSRESNLASHLTVVENAMLAMTTGKPLLAYLGKRRFENRIKQLLRAAKQGLETRMLEQVWSLSGGEHQMITLLLAAEMIRSSRVPGGVLLLDEHVAHLDPAASKVVMELTSALVKEHGLTVLMVTHNIQIAVHYGNRVLALKNRQIIFDRTYQVEEPRDPAAMLDLVS